MKPLWGIVSTLANKSYSSLAVRLGSRNISKMTGNLLTCGRAILASCHMKSVYVVSVSCAGFRIHKRANFSRKEDSGSC